MLFNRLKPAFAQATGRPAFRLTAAALLAFGCLLGPETSLIRVASAQGGKQGPVQSGNDAALEKAVSAFRRGQVAEAERLAAQTGDPLAGKILDWLGHTTDQPGASFADLKTFIEENPHWPARSKILLAAEKAMPGGLSGAAVIDWFDAHAPRTDDGLIRYADALIDAGRQAQAAAMLNDSWPEANLEQAGQARLLARYGTLIDKSTHIARLDRSLNDGEYTQARALAAYLGTDYKSLAEARIALAGRRPGAAAAINRVPSHLQDDAGLLFERLRWRRRNDDMAGAINLLKQMPPAAQLNNPNAWWTERHIIARELLAGKQYRQAYDVAAAHGLTGGGGFADGEFLAGWLALRFLNQPADALTHFENLYQGTLTPLSRSRGAYWAGRASEALGDSSKASQWYRDAAFHHTTFYGRLADEKLAPQDKPSSRMAVASITGRVSPAAEEMVRAAQLLSRAGMDGAAFSFLDALGDHAVSGEEYLLAAIMAEDLGYRHKAVQIAKDALVDGHYIPEQLYPVLAPYMKDVKRNQALVHGIIRQESVFDQNAVSPVGARGLMQLMPGTARETARKLGLPYNRARLTTDPAYNIRLGSSYLVRLLNQYDYDTTPNKMAAAALALAAYNGGAGNVAKWIRANGDPRDSSIDLIDWIEKIPFGETRNYVQRVLEGEMVYKDNKALTYASTAKPDAVLTLKF